MRRLQTCARWRRRSRIAGRMEKAFGTTLAAGVGLAHRRLAIIDLSPLAAQPMHSASGRMVISFNGEIYNYRALRSDLERAGRQFRSASDTEVLLEAIECWGVETALQRARGMFAFALWDRAGALAVSRARSVRREAAALRTIWQHPALRFGAQSTSRSFGLECAAQSGCVGIDAAPLLHSRAAYHLRRSSQGAPRLARAYSRAPGIVCHRRRALLVRPPDSAGQRANAPRERC